MIFQPTDDANSMDLDGAPIDEEDVDGMPLDIGRDGDRRDIAPSTTSTNWNTVVSHKGNYCSQMRIMD